MPHRIALFSSLVLLSLSGGCGDDGPVTPPGDDLGDVAEAYVKLALAVGRHDDNYIDAYYGPAEWRRAADAGDPVPAATLLEETRRLQGELGRREPSARRSYLEKQLVAVEGFLRRISGETLGLAEETRLLYDIEPPARSVGEFEAARARVERLLPGDGDLAQRVAAFRAGFEVPEDRVGAVVEAIVAEARRRTAERVELPAGERFETEYVRNKPWSAYNWYQGDLHSLIQVNLDLPVELGRILATMPHESYPGHHTYNALLERELVRGRGWPEFSVYVLYSPQSLIAEGTADAGVDVIMDAPERLRLMRDVLAPLAGLEGRDFDRYAELLEAVEPFKYARGEAARMLLDEGADDDTAVAFMVRYGLTPEDRARKSVDFIRTYRAYVYNYTAGEDLVLAHIGEGPDRAQRFFDLLKRPVVPSELVAAAD